MIYNVLVFERSSSGKETLQSVAPSFSSKQNAIDHALSYTLENGYTLSGIIGKNDPVTEVWLLRQNRRHLYSREGLTIYIVETELY